MFVSLLKWVTFSLIVNVINSHNLRSVLKSCDTDYTPTCFKYDIIVWVDRLAKQDRFEIVPGVQVVKDKDYNQSGLGLQLRTIQTQNESYLDILLLRKVQKYLQSRSIKLNILPNMDELNETGRTKEKEKMTMMVGMMMMAMKGMMMSKTMLIIGLLALKAAITGAVALALSLGTSFKSMSNGSPKHTRVEVMHKPMPPPLPYTDYGHGGAGGSGGGVANNGGTNSIPVGDNSGGSFRW